MILSKPLPLSNNTSIDKSTASTADEDPPFDDAKEMNKAIFKISRQGKNGNQDKKRPASRAFYYDKPDTDEFLNGDPVKKVKRDVPTLIKEIEDKVTFRGQLDNDNLRLNGQHLHTLIETQFYTACTGGNAPHLLRGLAFPTYKVDEVPAPALLFSIASLLLPESLAIIEDYMMQYNNAVSFKQPLIWGHGFQVTIHRKHPFFHDHSFLDFTSKDMLMKLIEYDVCGIHTRDRAKELLNKIPCFQHNKYIQKLLSLKRPAHNASSNDLAEYKDACQRFPNPFGNYTPAVWVNSHKKTQGKLTLNHAWNTCKPIVQNAHAPPKMKMATADYKRLHYETDEKGTWLPPSAHLNAETILKLFIYDLLCAFTDDEGRPYLSDEDIFQIGVDINYRQSSSPINYCADIVFNHLEADEGTLCWKCFDDDSDGSPFLCDIEGNRKAHNVVMDMILPVLALHAKSWNENKEKAIACILAKHKTPSTKVKKSLDKLTSIYIPADFSGKSDDGEKDPVGGLVRGLKKAIYERDITKDEAISLVMDLRKRKDGEYICDNLHWIISQIETYCHTEQVYEAVTSNYRPRRFKEAEWLTNFRVCRDENQEPIDYRQEVEDFVLSQPELFEKMVDVVLEYLKITFGPMFFLHLLRMYIAWDETSDMTKAGGVFLRGPTDIGKSFLLQLFLWAFNVRLIRNTDKNAVKGKDRLDDKRKIISIKPDAVSLDEFDLPRGFTSHGLSAQGCNNLFNFEERPANVDVKNNTLQIETKAIIFLATHYDIKYLDAKDQNGNPKYDGSFTGRFAEDCRIDLEEPVRLSDGTQIARPVFPLQVERPVTKREYFANTLSKHYSKIFKGMVPEQTEIDKKFAEKVTRSYRDVLMENPWNRQHLKLPVVSRPVAAYIFHIAMVKYWDELWCDPDMLTIEEKEEIFPLNSRRAISLENMLLNNFKFDEKHRNDKPRRFKPSEFLKFPELLENPRAIAHQLLLAEAEESMIISSQFL